MNGSINEPKIFISYSWSTPRHEQWVLSLAERLFGDGIIVILDKWDLKEGQDKHMFMEQAVNNKSITKVLVICDLAYQLKANERKGGVGTESQLISKEVYDNTGQEKFIPIVTEYNSNNQPCLPHFMSSRIFIDLSNSELFEENYQRLVRNLYDKPELKRPSLGTPPAYITEDDPIILKTSHKVLEIKNALVNNKSIATAFISDYYDLYIDSLEEFRISMDNNIEFDEKVLKSIEQMKPLRDDFIEFLFTLFKYQETVDLDGMKEFFERLYTFQYPSESVQSYTEVDCDNFRFFCYEIMLYFFSVLFKLRKYTEISFFLYSQYFYRYRYQSELSFVSIDEFNRHVSSLDENRNRRLNLRRASITADLIKGRADRKDLKFENIIETDLLLYYIRLLNEKGSFRSWFPRTSIFSSRTNSFDVFQKQISEKFFEKTKVIYNVNSKEELKSKLSNYTDDLKSGKRKEYYDFNYNLSSLINVIKIEQICSIP